MLTVAVAVNVMGFLTIGHTVVKGRAVDYTTRIEIRFEHTGHLNEIIPFGRRPRPGGQHGNAITGNEGTRTTTRTHDAATTRSIRLLTVDGSQRSIRSTTINTLLLSPIPSLYFHVITVYVCVNNNACKHRVVIA